ncbi:hypothetical protein EYZ11_004443 [Aspergillus tanneri]|uniref:C6 finger domain protein n=1 Tax=Aspergillus tanneri TaxID=1220188 RepID=A0A4S3JL36_9EURO|nr:hypothetical protein EYZ11_004443 [Aspergillus tanneri]
MPLLPYSTPSSWSRSSGQSRRQRQVSSGRNQNQGTGLDFTDVVLVPSVNAEDIRDRWLLQYISRVLSTYPRYMLKEGGVPPIIHSAQRHGTEMPRSLANCYSLVRMWEQAVPGSEMMVMNTVEQEMERLAEEPPSQNDYDCLAAFQAYLIYSIMIYFSPLSSTSTITDKTMITLMELAFRTARSGLFCASELARTRPTWEAWIQVAAKRRSIFTMYMFSSVYNADRLLPNFVADELRGVYAPGNKALWEAGDRESWGREYDRYLLDWEDGQLEISELWRSEQTGSVERRKRIERWVQTVDEFGMMMFAVCAHIHGC